MRKKLFIGFAIIMFGFIILFSQINSKKFLIKHQKIKKTSGAMEALTFWVNQRAYPEKAIPDHKYFQAFTESKLKLHKSAQIDAGIAPWKSIGPNNIGGRTNAIAFNPLNPNTIYVGSASGGLWRTHTAGVGANAWDYVETEFPVLGVNSIAIDPADTNVIYIATGEVYGYQNATGGLYDRLTRGSYGFGIFKTSDGGKTWLKSLDWSYRQQRGVQQIKINPQNSATIYAATTEGTYKSTDAGKNWLKVHKVWMAMDLAINPIDTNIVYVSCGNFGSSGTGIYRTIDGGKNWTKLGGGLPSNWSGKTMLAIYQAHPNVVYADIANIFSTLGLYRSTDNGETWKLLSTQDWAQYQGWYSHFVGVHPTDSSKVLAGGIDMWKSYDGGRTFYHKTDWWKWYFDIVPAGGPEGPSDYSHADHHAIAYHPTNPDIIYFGTDGGIFRTMDGGETFEGLNGGYVTTQFYNGFSCDITDSLLAIGGMQDNATAIYLGTVEWRRVIGGDGCWTAIDPEYANIMYGEYQKLSIQKTTTNGDYWYSATKGIEGGDAVNFVAPYVISQIQGNILYAGRGKVYKTTNGAYNWMSTNNGNALNGDPVLSMAISFTNPNVVYAGTTPVSHRASIFKTTNGGSTWQDITNNLPNRYPVDIAVDHNNDQIVYVVFSGFGTSHLFRSENGGENWESIGSGLPDVPTSAVIVDPIYSDHIYVGNDLGVYITTDGGTTWNEFSKGMSTAIVMDLSISYSNRMLRAATHGNGVFERKLLEPAASVTESPMTRRLPSVNLLQNYPNPFNRSTIISFFVKKESKVHITVSNMLGKKIITLVDKLMPVGLHQATWDASSISSGLYFYTLQIDDYLETRKCLLLK